MQLPLLYGKYKSVLNHLQSVALLLFRMIYGEQFFLAGLEHLRNHADTVSNFKDFGVPFPEINAWMAGGTEMICGSLLFLGVASRFISIPLIFTMLVALCTAHKASFIHIFQPVLNDDGTVKKALIYRIDDWFGQLPMPYLLTALLVLAFGPGLFSIDALIKKCCCKSCKEGPHIEAGSH